MRRQKKSPALFRLAWVTLILLVAVAAGILLAVLFAPEEKPSPDAPSDTTHTSVSTDSPGPEAPDAAALKAVADEVFEGKTFESGYFAVYDMTAGVMLYEKEAQAKITAASTTKLLTALTMLEYVTADTVFTVGSELSLVGAGSSTAKLPRGQKLTVEQALDALLIPSGNDAAYTIAAHVGRNLSGDPQINDRDAVDLFLEKMNDKAKSLGVENSLFTCPDGYPDKKQYTTAADMMKIAVAAAQNEIVRKTVEKTSAEIVCDNGKVLEYTNTNQLTVPSSQYFYEGSFGLKTGSTPGAGQCLISGATAYGHDILVALFKAPDNATRYTDTIALFDLAFAAVEKAEGK